MYTKFWSNSCTRIDYSAYLNNSYSISCSVSGTSVSGMPTVALIDTDGFQKYEFEPSEYFLFPTHKDDTQANTARSGLNYLFENNTIVEEDGRSKYQIGQLFVAKYGFRVVYEAKDDSGDTYQYGMKVYAKDTVSNESQSIAELVIIFLMFTIIVIFLYRICKMKEERLAKESKIFE